MCYNRNVVKAMKYRRQVDRRDAFLTHEFELARMSDSQGGR